MVPSTCIDAACVFINGKPLVVSTGTSFSFNEDGDLVIEPPFRRVEFGPDGERQPDVRGQRYVFRRDGTMSESGTIRLV